MNQSLYSPRVKKGPKNNFLLVLKYKKKKFIKKFQNKKNVEKN